MLKKIKSIVVVKKIFFHIFDRIKLNLVKYNKKLQNYLNISLINYRIYNKIIVGKILYMRVIQKEKFMMHIQTD